MMLKILFSAQNASTRLKTGKFCKSGFLHPCKKRKSPIDEKGLFMAFKAFSEF